MAFGVSFSGLDYVSHEDILPYSSTDQVPIQHELFERFLMYDQTKGNFWFHREFFRASCLQCSGTSPQTPSSWIWYKNHFYLGVCYSEAAFEYFFNYVKGIVLREEHSSYSVASPCEASPFSPHSPTFCSKGYSVCVAGEEPPLAGALGCAPRNHGEHPCHRHPFLHGHEGKSVLLCSFCHLLHWHVFCKTSLLPEGTFCLLEK